MVSGANRCDPHRVERPRRIRALYEQRLCQSSSHRQFLSVFRDVPRAARGAATREKSPYLTVSLEKLPGNVSDPETRANTACDRVCTALRTPALSGNSRVIAETALVSRAKGAVSDMGVGEPTRRRGCGARCEGCKGARVRRVLSARVLSAKVLSARCTGATGVGSSLCTGAGGRENETPLRLAMGATAPGVGGRVGWAVRLSMR
jgi:hypothetical protein